VVAAALVLVLAIVHRIGLGAPLFPVDDAYITAHNAQVLLDGGDTSFPGASALTGATSLVHLALTALLSIPAGELTGLYLAMWLGALLYATGIVRLAFAWGASPLQAGLLVVLGLALARVPHQLLNGLETGLALGITTWALALASEPGRERALAAVCGVMPFVRPELGALSAGLLALKGWPLLRDRRWRDAGVMAAFAVAGAAPWLLWSLIATGSLLPSTAGAKVAWFAERNLPLDRKEEWWSREVSNFAETIGIATLAGVAVLFFPLGRVVLAFAVVLLAFYYRDFPGALGHYEQRYLYVLLPGLILAFAWCFARHGWVARVALAVAVIGLGHALVRTPDRWDRYLETRDFTRVELAGVADWADANLPRGSKLLVHDAGYISYATRFELADLVGLKTPRVVPIHENVTLPSAGARRPEAIHLVALQERPDYFVVLDGWEGVYQMTNSLRGFGWAVEPLRTGAGYSVYALRPPAPPPAP
jgi:MFS family permease